MNSSVGVALRNLAFVLRRSLHAGLDQARVDQRAALDEYILSPQLPVRLGATIAPATRPPPAPAGSGKIVWASGISSLSPKPQNRRNDGRFDNASSSPASDNEYHCCRSSAFSIDSGECEGRPHTRSHRFDERPAASSQSSARPSVRPHIRSQKSPISLHATLRPVTPCTTKLNHKPLTPVSGRRVRHRQRV